jgi:hypothetical protein
MVGPTIRPPAPSVMLAPRRAVATLALFVAGLAIGVAGYGVVNAAPPLPTYPPLASAPEPQIAHDLAAAIVAGDAKGIADHLQPDAADALSTALKPIVEVTSMEYLGTVEQDGKDLAGYVIHGRDQNKAKQVVGVVVDVSGGTIVAINQ